MAAASRKLLIRPAELRYGPASQPRFPPSLQLLQGLLRTEIGDQPGDALLFPSRRGGWPTVGELRWVFDPAATKAGVGRLVPHELRHTCASMGIKAPGRTSRWFSTFSGTAVLMMDRYGHLHPDELGRVANAFDAAAVPLRSRTPLAVVE